MSGNGWSGDSVLPVVVLAAGQASRMGQAKQLLEVNGESLLAMAIRKGASVSGGAPIVVTGAYHQQLEPVIKKNDAYSAFNPNWMQGMGSSIAVGIHKVEMVYPQARGAFIILADQPRITSQKLQSFVSVFLADYPKQVVAAYNGTYGAPAIFHRDLFPELGLLSEQKGAKKIILKYLVKGTAVSCPDAAFDVDTPQEWQQFVASQHKK
ncbi:MAG: nucleotidyltransferase family protein [Saprospiraceae bacterium]|nr:nucleotidyltransferase family protein [Saprospiraceae bacterium]